MNNPDDIHQYCAELLPWYVNGTLTTAEHGIVKRHLAGCAECRDGVDLLHRMSAAVRRKDTVPIVPPANPGRLFAAVDARLRRRLRGRHAGIAAAALALVVLVFTAGLLVSGRHPADTPEPRYRTLTSERGPRAMDYVMDLEFAAGVTAAARQRVLEKIAASDVRDGAAAGTYRVTLELPGASLQELERVTDGIEALPEVRSLRVVAVQLPLQDDR